MQVLSHAPQLGGIITLQVHNGAHPHLALAGSCDAQTLTVQHVYQADLQQASLTHMSSPPDNNFWPEVLMAEARNHMRCRGSMSAAKVLYNMLGGNVPCYHVHLAAAHVRCLLRHDAC